MPHCYSSRVHTSLCSTLRICTTSSLPYAVCQTVRLISLRPKHLQSLYKRLLLIFFLFTTFLLPQDSPLMSIIKEVGLPKLPSQSRNDEGRDLSERVPPPRSSSPVIGSPPVRAVPIGTPPKQPMSHALNHQVSIRQQ